MDETQFKLNSNSFILIQSELNGLPHERVSQHISSIGKFEHVWLKSGQIACMKEPPPHHRISASLFVQLLNPT